MPQDFTPKFFFLSYRNETTGLYGKGYNDAYLVLFLAIMLTMLRAVAIDYIFTPYARRAGISPLKAQVRFAEQAWQFFCYSMSWSLGMYLMYNSPYWMNTDSLWTGWPHRELKGLFKWYYLTQIAFYIQQNFVLNIEARRKDYHQMFTHHIITSCLLSASYAHYFTRIGNAVLCLMDIGDIILPLAKMLKYLGYQMLCDVMFAIFIITWFIARHVLYVKLVLSTMFDSRKLIGSTCFFVADDMTGSNIAKHPNLNTTHLRAEDEQCYTEVMQYSFVSLLWMIECLAIAWFYMIVNVAVKVICGGEADDSRSDDEDEEEEDEIQRIQDLDEKRNVQLRTKDYKPINEKRNANKGNPNSSRRKRDYHEHNTGIKSKDARGSKHKINDITNTNITDY